LRKRRLRFPAAFGYYMAQLTYGDRLVGATLAKSLIADEVLCQVTDPVVAVCLISEPSVKACEVLI
jgi:hypothetical protein